jgi:hypothetical protein
MNIDNSLFVGEIKISGNFAHKLRSRFLAVCGNSAAISPHSGKELAKFRLHFPRISAEVPCGFPCPSASLPRRRCWISTARGGAFLRGVIDNGSENRGLRERVDAGEHEGGPDLVVTPSEILFRGRVGN